MQPVILFRQDNYTKSEFEEIKNLNKFDLVNYRSEIKPDSLVIGRYSVLPFYKELNVDIENLGSKMLQNVHEHQYIANMDYIYDLKDFTPKTWFRLQDVPEKFKNKPFVLKGRTNSRKQQWKTKMFANNFTEAVNIANQLLDDQLINSQGIVIREFNELITYEYDLMGLPRTCEYRLFFLKDKLLAFGYYWGNIENQELPKQDYQDFLANGIPFAKKMAEIVKENATFFVIDIAKTVENKWIVIELNDGQMSGLNDTISPQVLYSNLYREMVNLNYTNEFKKTEKNKF